MAAGRFRDVFNGLVSFNPFRLGNVNLTNRGRTGSGVAPRRNRNAHEYQGLKPLATVRLSLRDFGIRIIS